MTLFAPAWLLLIPVLVAGLVAVRLARSRRQAVTRPVGAAGRAAVPGTPAQRRRERWLLGWREVRRDAVLVVFAVLVALALSAPALELPAPGRALAVLIDRSGSMVRRFDAASRTDPVLARALAGDALDALGDAELARPADSLLVIEVGPRPRVLREAAPLGDESLADAIADALAIGTEDQAEPPIDRAASAPIGRGAVAPGSDVAGAIRLALAQLPVDRPAVIVLVGDARDTGADPAAARAEATGGNSTGALTPLASAMVAAQSRGVTVVARCPPPLYVPDVRFGAARVPARLRIGEPLVVRVPVIASLGGPVPVDVRAYREGVADADVRLALLRGSVPLPPVGDDAAAPGLRVDLPGDGAYTLLVEAPGREDAGLLQVTLVLSVIDEARRDWVPENDRLTVGAFVAGRSRALVLAPPMDESDAATTPAAGLIRHALPGFEVEVRSPARAPTSVAELMPFDLVVNAGVSRSAFGEPAFAAFDAAIAEAVRTLGIGYAMIGGPGSFGPGGYIGTQQDAILPVDCDPNRDVPVAVSMALDCSPSMWDGLGGEKQLRAVAAARELLDVLADGRDSVGILPFALTQLHDYSVRPLGDRSRARLSDLLSRIAAGEIQENQSLGPVTDISAALSASLESLRDSEQAVRMLLVISDGVPMAGARAYPGAEPLDEDHRRLHQFVEDARDAGVVVHFLVVTGQGETRLDFFESLVDALNESDEDDDGATAARSSLSVVTDAVRLPAAMLDAFRESKGALARVAELGGEEFFAIHDELGRPLPDGMFPPLLGYARTRPKPIGAPDVRLQFAPERDEPLLALWRHGAGATLAATVPFEEPDWIAPWLSRSDGGDGARLPSAVTAALSAALRDLASMIGQDEAGRTAAPWTVEVVPASGSDHALLRVTLDEAVAADVSIGESLARWHRHGLRLTLAGVPGSVAVPAVAPLAFEATLPDAVSPGTVTVAALATPETSDGGGAATPFVTRDRFAISMWPHLEWREPDADAPALAALNGNRQASAEASTALALLERDARTDRLWRDVSPWLFLAAALLLVIEALLGWLNHRRVRPMGDREE